MPEGPPLRFAAVDIGSNGVRLLLSRVFENGGPPLFKKESLVRLPLRLGDDVFLGQPIPAAKADSLVAALRGFQHLIGAYGALGHAACATSAMREASNGAEIAARIRGETGIALEIVDGRREAEIICKNRPAAGLAARIGLDAYLFVDVGGGSVEATVFRAGSLLDSRSFNLGTIRLLKDLVPAGEWEAMREWLRGIRLTCRPRALIGSGGNINKIFRLSRQKEGKPLSAADLKELRDFLAGFTVEERILRLGLRPDRADVILPAADIFVKAMKWSGVRRIYVPEIGLSDGLVHEVYDRYRRRTSAAEGAR